MLFLASRERLPRNESISKLKAAVRYVGQMEDMRDWIEAWRADRSVPWPQRDEIVRDRIERVISAVAISSEASRIMQNGD